MQFGLVNYIVSVRVSCDSGTPNSTSSICIAFEFCSPKFCCIFDINLQIFLTTNFRRLLFPDITINPLIERSPKVTAENCRTQSGTTPFMARSTAYRIIAVHRMIWLKRVPIYRKYSQNSPLEIMSFLDLTEDLIAHRIVWTRTNTGTMKISWVTNMITQGKTCKINPICPAKVQYPIPWKKKQRKLECRNCRKRTPKNFAVPEIVARSAFSN